MSKEADGADDEWFGSSTTRANASRGPPNVADSGVDALRAGRAAAKQKPAQMQRTVSNLGMPILPSTDRQAPRSDFG